MTNETVGGIKRLDDLIGGDSRWDVNITGGNVDNVTIDNATITGLAAPLPIADGGTGQVTANAALNALLPTQTGQSGKTLKTDGTDATWQVDTSGITQLTGDVTTASGSGSQAATLATVNAGSGSVGSSTAIPVLTTNAKGLVTAQTTVAVIAPAGTLTGATLAAGVTASSLTSVGTIATGVWNGTVIGANFGGTGVANNVAATLARSGNHALTLTTTGVSALTLPTAGTVATLAGSEAFTNKSVNGVTLTTGGSATQFLNGAGSYAAVDSPVKAWVNFSGTGTVTIRASFNVSSVTDNGVGDYTVNFTTPLADANYAITGSCGDYLASGSSPRTVGVDSGTAPTASACRINTTVAGTGGIDVDRVSVAFFR